MQRTPHTRNQSYRTRARDLADMEIDFVDNASFRRKPGKRLLNELKELLGESSDRIVSDTLSDAGICVSATPLLTKEQEAVLFRMMNYYKYRASLLQSKLNAEEPERLLVSQLEEALRNVEKIRDRIILSNLRLVISIARRLSSNKYNFEEVISDGNLILMRAIEKFDYSRGFRFSTYATHAIQRDIFRKFKKIGRRGDVVQGTTQAALEEQPDSLDPTDDQLQQLSVVSELQELIDEKLDDRERFIVRARFGLEDDTTPLRLRSIAEELGLSKERVRQLQNRAIAKLQACINWDAVLS